MDVGALDFTQVDWTEFGTATKDTLAMLGASALFTLILGLPLGIILFMSARSTSPIIRVVYSVLSVIVNILRSVPFIILIVALLPLTDKLVGTTIGVKGTIPPLVIAQRRFLPDWSRRHCVKWIAVLSKLLMRWALLSGRLSPGC